MDQKTFWSISEENGKLSPEILDLFIFLSGRGYRKRVQDDIVEIFRQNGYWVEQSFTPDAITEVTRYLKDYKDDVSLQVDYPRKGPVTYRYNSKQILEKFVKYGWGKIFNTNNFNHLPELNVQIRRHTREAAYFYFKNGYVEVTKSGAKLHLYSNLNGQYIYKDYLIDRDISPIRIYDKHESDFAPNGYSFYEFLCRLAGVPKEDGDNTGTDKLAYLMVCIGFLLHDYKQQGLTDFSVIMCDDNAGGTGKGIIAQALRKMTACAEVDGKKPEYFDPEELTERTRIKIYNDVEPSFPFKIIYNETTDQAVIRHMYKNPFYIPYENVWKVLVLSNHVIRGNSSADLRRQRVFLLNSYFSEKFTPIDEYKHPFFSNAWEERDWNYFYNIMFECVRLWLNCDYKLTYKDDEYQAMKLEEEYPAAFRMFMEEIVNGIIGTETFKTSELYYKFKEHDKYRLEPFVRKLNANFFSRLLTRWLTDMKIPFSKNSNRTEIWITRRK
jgi:hypothetical protein